jgi:uncharacterized repeat protein (TIGR01451 family)
MKAVRCLSFFLLPLLSYSAQSANSDARSPRMAESSRASAAFGSLPLSFELNRGQTSPEVKFLSRGHGYVLFLTGDEAVLKLQHAAAGNQHSAGGTPENTEASAVRMKFVDAVRNPGVSGTHLLPGKSNYFIGNDPKQWRTNVPIYGGVQYKGIYPGVDLVYYGTEGQIEYDFVVSPGASPERIALQFDGAQPALAANGDLALPTPGGDLRFHKPVIYQTRNSQSRNGSHEAVDGHFVVAANHRVSFAVGNYDHSRPLIIDPLLVYSTFLGGTNTNEGYAIAVDSAGSAYVTGTTLSSDFPTKNPIETYHTGGACAGGNCLDAFVTKFNATGTALVYSTFLGGVNSDYGFGIAVDKSKNAYIVGRTASNDFPVAGASPVHTQCGEIFVLGVPTGTCDETHYDPFAAKLNPAGNAIVYSSFLGGTADDWATGVAVDSAGEAYIVGQTRSPVPTGDPNNPGFPITTTGFLTFLPVTGQIDTFFVKLNASGGGPLYGTFLGSTTQQADSPGTGIAVDKSGNAYVTGYTNAPDFPVTTGAYKTSCVPPPLRLGICNFTQAFVSKLNPALSSTASLIYSTYLGGTAASDQANAIAVDSAGSAYVTGEAISPDFPTTAGALQTTCAPFGTDCVAAFVTKFNPKGTGLVYSTFLGDQTPPTGKLGNATQGLGITLDTSKNAYVTGWVHEGNAASPSFPVVNPVQTLGIVFVSKLNASGKALLFSTHFGGEDGVEQANGIAVDTKGAAYVTGYTLNSNFTTTPGAFQTKQAGSPGNNLNAFAFKIATLAADLSLTNAGPTSVTSGSNIQYVIDTINNGPDTAGSVAMSDTVPTGTTFISVTTNVGTCTAPAVGATGRVTCKVSSLANAASLNVTLTVNVTATSGHITDTATVSSTAFDINTKNNTAKVTTTVN